MIDLDKISSGITFKDGVWYSGDITPISYLDDGNEIFYKIEDNSFWFQHRNKAILTIASEFKIGDFFLDVGGGNGVVSKYLQDNGISSVLVEPGKDGVSNAKKRGVKALINAKLQDINFDDKTIPSIGAFDVLEHIEDIDELLNEIHRVLKDDGLFIITVPAYNLLWSNEDVIAGHFRRYTRKSIKDKLIANGFSVERSTYLFSFLALPILLFRAIPSIFLKPDGKKPETKAHKKSGGFSKKIINLFLNRELRKIKRKRLIRFGSSILIVAKKINRD